MPIEPGERLPFWAGLSLRRELHTADTQAGRAAAMLVATTGAGDGVQAMLRRLGEHRDAFRVRRCDPLALLPFEAIPALHRDPGFAAGATVLLCGGTLLETLSGGMPGGAALLLDRAGRLLLREPLAVPDPEQVADRLLAACPEAGRTRPPPLLFLPGLLDADLRRALVARFEASASFDSPLSGTDAEGCPADRIDHARKRRRDWLIETDDPLHPALRRLLLDRCLPELERGFGVRPTDLDRLLLARYDAGAGHFRRHRDNVAPAVAFRQFALSVNLGDDAFEGGDLVFCEYDDRPCRPAPGEGLLFSASLLHEVTPVTRGRRHALLSFLHGAPAAAAAPCVRSGWPAGADAA